MPIPIGALQRRLATVTAEANRESPTTENRTRGIVLGIYSIMDISLPLRAKRILESNPGLCVAEVMLLTRETIFLPLECSPDEKEMIYGNNANIKHRPVEVRYMGSNVENGKVYFSADPLSVSLSENQMPRPLDVFGAMS